MIKKDPFCIPYELARLGFDVLVIAPYDAIHVPGCRMARIRNIQISSKILPKYITDRLLAIVLFFDTIRTLRVLLDEGINIVITYYYPLHTWLLGLFRKVGQYRVVCKMDWDGVIRGLGPMRIIRKLILIMTWKHCDVVIVESYEALRNVAKEFPDLIEKVRVVYNGWCDKLLSCSSNDVRKRQIVSTARITPTKGIHDLITAFYIANKRVTPKWRLIIVGPIEDRQYYEYLQNLIKKFDLKNYVSITGKISDEELAHIYAESSIFVLPSYQEGFSIARVEALACGLPVVTTETGGSEVVRGVGIIVRPGDVYGLARALKELMSNDELRRKLGKLALDKARALTWRSIAKRIARIIENL